MLSFELEEVPCPFDDAQDRQARNDKAEGNVQRRTSNIELRTLKVEGRRGKPLARNYELRIMNYEV